MSGPRVQFHGRVDEDLSGPWTHGSLALADPFGLRDDMEGIRVDRPDLHLELHTREYYARWMTGDAPRAVWFLNLPGGYFHNEALLDHYDLVFFSHPLGLNYRRHHPRCHFIPPWLPRAWTGGRGEAHEPGRLYLGGRDLGQAEAEELAASRALLRGRYAGAPTMPWHMPLLYALALKGAEVLAERGCPMAGACLEAGAGLYEPGDPRCRPVRPCLPLAERRERILSGHLFAHRLAEILRICLDGGGSGPA